MYDPVVLRAQMREQEHERQRASVRKDVLARRVSVRQYSLRKAMSLSVAFAAGWLIASIF